MGHRPRNCKKQSSIDTREGESDESESESEDESRTHKHSHKKSHTKSFLRKSGEKAYGRDLRRSNNGM